MKFLEVNTKRIIVKPFFKFKKPLLIQALLTLLIIWLPLKDSLPSVFGSGFLVPVFVLVILVTLALTKGLVLIFGKIEKAFLIFLTLLTISAALNSFSYGIVTEIIKDWAVIAEFFFLYILGKNLSKEEFLPVLKIGLVEAILISIYAIWQFYIKVPLNPLWVVPGEALRTRAFATFLSPNALASYLVIWFWVPLAIIRETGKKCMLSLVPIVPAIYFTYSRSALLAVAVGVIALVVINYSKLTLKTMALIFTFAVSTVLFYAKRLLGLLDPTYIFYSDEAGRAWATKNVLHILPNHLFYGVGPGMYGGQTATEVPSPVYLESIQHGFAATYLTDNQYLQILIQQGLFGLFAYFYLFFEITRALYQKAKQELFWGGAIFAIWIGYSIQGFFENIWFIQATATMIWIIMGISLKEEK